MISGSRLRRTGKTKYCGVISLRIKEPKETKRDMGDYHCIICGSRFTRVEGVNYHFPKCVERYGNPQGNNWNDHPSCAGKKSRKGGRSTDTDSDVQPPPSKRRCIVSLPSRLPTGDAGRSNARAPSPPEAQPRALAPRATRSTARATERTSENAPASSFGTRKTASRPAKSASKPSRSRDDPTPAEPGREQHVPVAHGSQERSTRSRAPSRIVRQTGTYKSFIDESLAPLSDTNAIFHDLVSRAWNKIPMGPVMEDLSKRRIHVATMCSGTESPLLALDKIQDGKYQPRPLT